MNTSVSKEYSLTKLYLTPESIDCAEQIADLTRQNSNLQRMLEIAHEEARKNRKKLTALSHFNSHTVRGTLTRIWAYHLLLSRRKARQKFKLWLSFCTAKLRTLMR